MPWNLHNKEEGAQPKTQSIADRLGIKLKVEHLSKINDRTGAYLEANDDTIREAAKELALEVDPMMSLLIEASPYFMETLVRVLSFGYYLGSVKVVDSIKKLGLEEALDLMFKE